MDRRSETIGMRHEIGTETAVVRTVDENSTALAPGQAERMYGQKAGTDVGKHAKNGWDF